MEPDIQQTLPTAYNKHCRQENIQLLTNKHYQQTNIRIESRERDLEEKLPSNKHTTDKQTLSRHANIPIKSRE